MRRTTELEQEAVLRLDDGKRFSHFIKRVADEEQAWSLWSDGWAMMANADGDPVFPLWPAREYAALHRVGEWSEYEVLAIPLVELLHELLPQMSDRGVRPGVFPLPAGSAKTPSPEMLAAALEVELEKYE